MTYADIHATLDALETDINKLKNQIVPTERSALEFAREVDAPSSQPNNEDVAIQAEITRLQRLLMQSKVFPWKDPGIMQGHRPQVGYNYKMTGEQYQKILWVIAHVPGHHSIQSVIHKAVESELKRVLKNAGVS